jgi:asparagine synthase (glutamine-hydrolysing)
MRGYMADVLLRDSDVMSMRHSLELRVPFVDRPLVRWLAGQPVAFKHTPGRPKSALADAVRDLLPPELLTRKKRGFTLPYALWMRGPLKPFLDDTFSTASVGRSGLFNAAAVQAHWRRFLAGNDSLEWSRVWSLAILVAFINRRPPSTA